MLLNIEEIADKADMIINGYAFTKDGDYTCFKFKLCEPCSSYSQWQNSRDKHG